MSPQSEDRPNGKREPVAAARPTVRCRPIEPADLEALAVLLAQGFPARRESAWRESLNRLRDWAASARLPGLGLVLVDGDRPVGCLLTLYSPDGRRCNVSSWYVEENYRRYGSMLVTIAMRDRTVTYINVSSERHTRPTIEAQGFRRYTEGILMAVPLLSVPGLRRATVSWTPPAGAAVDTAEAEIVAHHAALGCITFWCVAGGRAFPFVVVRRPYRWGVPIAVLVYCARETDWRLVAFAVGRALARHRMFLLVLDAAKPIAGLAGRFVADRMPKYARGPDTPAYGDLAYTEIAVIGT